MEPNELDQKLNLILENQKTILEKFDKLLPSKIVEETAPPIRKRSDIKKMKEKEFQDYIKKKYLPYKNPLVTSNSK